MPARLKASVRPQSLRTKVNEQDYIWRLAAEAHETVDMLSSHRKGEREQRVSAAFLRCLGVDFSPDGLVAPANDPPDVVFRDARFEVMIVLDEGRRMHADWKEEASRRDSVHSLDDLAESYQSSVPMSLKEAVCLVVAKLRPKASHYGPKTCSQLDALVYINCKRRYLYPISEVIAPTELQSQSWRSVCFLFLPYSHVLFATPEAPEFLRNLKGRTRQECDNTDVWFEL